MRLLRLYLQAFGLDPRGVRDLPRKLISLGLTVGWLFLTGLVGPSVRAGGPVVYGIVILAAFTGFWWFSMRFLLAGRIPWRKLFPSAVATGLCWLGMVAWGIGFARPGAPPRPRHRPRKGITTTGSSSRPRRRRPSSGTPCSSRSRSAATTSRPVT